MRSSRPARRFSAIPLIAASVLLAILAIAPAANAAPASGAGKSAAATSPKRCVFGGGNPVDCKSSNPEVTKVLYSGNGDCSTTRQVIHIDWGDGTPVHDVQTNGPAPRQKLPVGSHAYAKRGTYPIKVTGAVVSGPCTFTPTSYTFTLAKVTGELALAALGDSYSSGEGTGEYYTDSGSCHRSPDAWSRLLAIGNPHVTLEHADFLACSGATSSALFDEVFKGQQPQADTLKKLRPVPSLITLTIGGNDVGFSNILSDCYHTNCIKDGVIKAAAARIHAKEVTLRNDYVKIAGTDPSATFLVVGYPRIFDSSSYCGVKWLGLGFKPAELAALNDLGKELNTVIAEAAAKAGVAYVDVTNALHGHEMCSTKPWVVQVNLKGLWDQEEGHPIIPGQKAIEKVVRGYIDDKL